MVVKMKSLHYLLATLFLASALSHPAQAPKSPSDIKGLICWYFDDNADILNAHVTLLLRYDTGVQIDPASDWPGEMAQNLVSHMVLKHIVEKASSALFRTMSVLGSTPYSSDPLPRPYGTPESPARDIVIGGVFAISTLAFLQREVIDLMRGYFEQANIGVIIRDGQETYIANYPNLRQQLPTAPNLGRNQRRAEVKPEEVRNSCAKPKDLRQFLADWPGDMNVRDLELKPASCAVEFRKAP